MIRVVYTGTRKPPIVDGIQLIHVPALQKQCLNPSPSLLPSAPCIAVFFSQNAVECALQLQLLDALNLEGVIAVGEATSQLLMGAVGVPVYTPSAQSFDGVVDLLRSSPMFNGKLLCSFELRGGPHTMGGITERVVVVPIYATDAVGLEGLEASIRAATPDWIVFASPRAVALWAALPARPDCLVASIGPTTTEALRRVGIEPDLVPETPDLEALLALIAKA